MILSIANLKVAGQGVGISEINIVPEPSAILELRSAVRGFLAPRMTTDQRLILGGTSPAAGLLVYDTDTKSFWYWIQDGRHLLQVHGELQISCLYECCR
jgi:hypothetical protein